jgi:hypothetical protein
MPVAPPHEDTQKQENREAALPNKKAGILTMTYGAYLRLWQRYSAEKRQEANQERTEAPKGERKGKKNKRKRPKQLGELTPKQFRKQARKLKLTREEWLELERLQTKYMPRTASAETRSSVILLGSRVGGGLPGLGKRR